MRARTPYLYPHAHQHRAPRRLTEVGGRGAEKGAAGAWRKEKRAAGEEEGPPQARGGVGSPHLGDPETVRTALIKNISSPTILAAYAFVIAPRAETATASRTAQNSLSTPGTEVFRAYTLRVVSR